MQLRETKVSKSGRFTKLPSPSNTLRRTQDADKRTRRLPPSPRGVQSHSEAGAGGQGAGLGLVGLVGGRPAGLQHLLHEVEADARLALILGDGKVVEQVEVAHVRAVRVAVLVHQPLPLGGVGVARPDVLGLEMLQLAVDGVAVRHGAAPSSQMADGSDITGRRVPLPLP